MRMYNFKYKYALLKINSVTMQSHNENNKRLVQSGYSQFVTKWSYEKGYYLTGQLECLYSDKKRTKKQINDDLFQELFTIACENYNPYNRAENDDDIENVTLNSNDDMSVLWYETKYNDRFSIFVSNNNSIAQNENFEVTVIVPQGFTSIALIVSPDLRNLVVKTNDNVVLKEVHSVSKNAYNCYIRSFNLT